MLSNFGFGEMLVIGVIGLFLIGPERLPKAATDLAKLIKQLRALADSAMSDLKAELPPELTETNLRRLHPRRIVEDAWRDRDQD